MDTNLDDKIRAVESVFKNDGFVWIIKFWQAAYKTNTGEVCLDGYHGVIHAENSRVTQEKQSEILKLCLEIGLLYKTESGNYTSNGIQKRIKHIMIERERWRNKEENELSSEIIPEITPEIRGEIKLNKTKLKEKQDNIASWRTDFKIYEKEVGEAYDALIIDTAWLADRKQYHPRLDIELTLQKSFNDFWGIEAGWAHKKKSRAKVIDWKATFANALTLRSNQVWRKEPDRK